MIDNYEIIIILRDRELNNLAGVIDLTSGLFFKRGKS